MKVLGLNGWTGRGHDGGASLIIDGKLIASIEEEKLINKRHAFDRLPIESIKSVLKIGNVSLDEIDKIAFGWDYEEIYRTIGEKFVTKKEMSKILFGTTKYSDKIDYISHHLAHAYSTFIPSNYEEALVLIVDGQGEINGTSIYKASRKENKMELLMESTASLGYFYSAATEHIGLSSGEEGKTMGLTAYGEPVYYNELKKLIYIEAGVLKCPFKIQKVSKDEEDETIKKWLELFAKIIEKRTKKGILEISKDVPKYANFAKSIQKVLEEILKELITYYYNQTKINNVAIAGGVGLNCPANSAIESLDFIEDVFVQPAANDGGISLGAAIKAAIDLGDNLEIEMIPYLGTEYTDSEIKDELDELSKKYFFTYQKSNDIAKSVAKLIYEDNIVANFQGKIELGPRALGNRSLLASPIKKEMLIKMNNLKGREIWRPLAPAVLFEEQKKWFDYEKFSPFMIKNCLVNEEKRDLLKAITHVDGSARIQSVNKEYNEKFYNIIKEFFNLSNVPVVINTSFNIKGMPIVATVEEAIKSIIEMNIDYMSIGDYLVKIDYDVYKKSKIAIVSSINFVGIVPDDLLLCSKLKDLGFYAHIVAWEDDKEIYDKYNTIVIRSTWDYSKNLANYRKWLLSLKNKKINVINPSEMILTNINKYNQFLILEKNGLSNNVLTITIKNKDMNDKLEIIVKRKIDEKFSECDAVVIKPFISANAYNTYMIEVKGKLNRPDTINVNQLDDLYSSIIKEEENGIIIQEFFDEIDEGEPSIYCIDKQISHVTRKFTKVFDKSGKVNRTFDSPQPLASLSDDFYSLAKQIIAIPEYEEATYMRIDLVKTKKGLIIMEVELAEPNFHFKDIVDEKEKDLIVTNFAKAIKKNIDKKMR